MTINEFQKAAMRTVSGISSVCNDNLLLNGVMGLNGEAGEAIEIVKKSMFHGHNLDKEHLAKELGDVSWYLAISAQSIGYDLETIFKMNVEKLMKRYPDGFDEGLSKNRKNEDI